MVRLTDRPDMTLDVYRGRKTTIQYNNTCFKKRDSHLIMYKSVNAATQIDFILFPRAMRKLVNDMKVIPGEEVALHISFLYVT